VGPLFSRTCLQGFGFDIEVLYLATKMGYGIKEGPVSWHHVPGSKVNLLRDAPAMFWSILLVRNWHCTPINQFNQHMGPDEYRYMFDMEKHHWWFVSHKRLLLKLIENTGKRLPAILDVGAGTGGKLFELGNIGKAVGVDVSEKAVDFCRRRGLSNVSQCPAENIAHPDKSFDLVVCMEVLEHVVNPVQVLGELKRVLKDDGKLILSVPAFKLLWSQHDEALCHLRRYEKKTIAADLLEAGFRIEKIGYLFFVSFFVVAPIRILRRLRKPDFKCDTTTLPPRFLNEALKLLFDAEIRISTRFGLPLGTTLYAVVSK
jgi:SAM-dependent methyltransferase